MAPSAQIVIPITPAERAAVEAILQQRTLSPRLRERLEMVKAAGLGFEWETIAAWSGRTPRTVRRWLMRFATGGIAALGDAPRSGRPRPPMWPITLPSTTLLTVIRVRSASRSMPG